MLFHHKSDTIYQLRKKICYKIFLEIGECVLQKEQIFFRHIYKHSLNNTHQEVESLSQNVKMGLKMKMKRGELIGFNGCLGYDYHPEDKTLTINEEEAEGVRFIYDMYLQGYGTTTIANRLVELGKKNKKGEVSWHTYGVMGIIKNEKYKGDILLGKTFTTDPISKRRLANM